MSRLPWSSRRARSAALVALVALTSSASAQAALGTAIEYYHRS
jgi:hypothetical protein